MIGIFLVEIMLNVWASTVNGTLGQAFFEARTGRLIRVEVSKS
jgi:hypothetical protein